MANKNYRFEVFVDYDFEVPEYVVRYFDIPVGGQGKTAKEAVAEAEENLNAYLEMAKDLGMEIPEPSPHVKTIDLSGKLTLRISKTLHQEIIQNAEAEGVSINAFLNDAISYYIYNRNKPEEKTIKYICAFNNIDQIIKTKVDEALVNSNNQNYPYKTEAKSITYDSKVEA